MDIAVALEIARQAILTAFYIAGPILIVSMIVGIVISILQATTQINEQTLTFVPKLIAIAAYKGSRVHKISFDQYKPVCKVKGKKNGRNFWLFFKWFIHIFFSISKDEWNFHCIAYIW